MSIADWSQAGQSDSGLSFHVDDVCNPLAKWKPSFHNFSFRQRKKTSDSGMKLAPLICLMPGYSVIYRFITNWLKQVLELKPATTPDLKGIMYCSMLTLFEFAHNAHWYPWISLHAILLKFLYILVHEVPRYCTVNRLFSSLLEVFEEKKLPHNGSFQEYVSYTLSNAWKTTGIKFKICTYLVQTKSVLGETLFTPGIEEKWLVAAILTPRKISKLYFESA